MRVARLIVGIATAVLLPLACGPDNGGVADGGGVDSSSYDASDPATGRWFGTIFVDAAFDASGTSAPGPGIVIQKTHVETAHTRIDISQDGHRHTATTYHLLDDQVTDNNQGCIRIHGTNVINETATNSSDVGSYFALAADGDTGYKSGEFPGGFQFTPTQPFVSHNRMALDQCGSGTMQTSDNPESPTVAGILPFDHVKGTLSPDRRNANGSTEFDFNGVHYSMRWTLQRDNEIVAVVDDQTVTRVATVHLDGSKSRGTIDTYDWTITPMKGRCDRIGISEVVAKLQIGKEVTPTGETYDFPILCDVYVKLHVTGPAGTSDAYAWIDVNARPWTVQTNEKDARKKYVTSSDLGNGLLAGSNRCLLEKGQPSGHFIHSDSPSTYENSAYTVQQLDPNGDGPFAGDYYLDSPNVIVKRTELVNVAYTDPSGTAYQATAAANANVAAMLDEQISAHEEAHSTLVFDTVNYFKGGPEDMALRIEDLASSASADLVQMANTSLNTDNELLCIMSSHAFVSNVLLQRHPTDATWTGSAQICNPICTTVDPFYAAAFDDAWCLP